jgi:predicted anti-sigma-YlaC factor YlaD
MGFRSLIFLTLALLVATGCNAKRFAIRKLGDALAQSGSTFASDDDPELIRLAVPTNLKLVETLLNESPDHAGLLLAAARGFTQYTYAFLQQDADELEEKDLSASTNLRLRARKLYRRARDYGLRGLEAKHKGFAASLRANPKEAALVLEKSDVQLIYWTAAAWGSLISLSKDNPDVIADQLLVEALLDRAMELDEGFDHGALHSLFISYELARQGAAGDAVERSRQHFNRAMELSRSQLAGPCVALAESVSIKQQNAKEFKSLLEQALAINADARPEWRLENLVMQRRARWLLTRMDDLFLLAEPAPEKAK